VAGHRRFPPFLYKAGGGWIGWRRQTAGGLPSFYNEGTLIWLAAEVTIRKLTNGRKTLDDFCALFHGQNDNGTVWVKAYDAAEVYRTLNQVAAFDWQAFFEADGTIDDAWPGAPAYAAGISTGMKIVAVDGRRFSIDQLRRALVASTDATTPMAFIVDNAGYFKTVSVDYHGGLRYPHLERVAGTADLLTGIAVPGAR
jgi:predicted metalloprotease with PDZ domain